MTHFLKQILVKLVNDIASTNYLLLPTPKPESPIKITI